MADITSVLEIQSNTAPEKEVDKSRGAQEVTVSQPPLVITEGDDSVFYNEGEEVPQQILESIWAPCSGEPIWPEKLSAPQLHTSGAHPAFHSVGLMEASSEHDSIATLREMEGKTENKVNNASSTDTDGHVETAANSRITDTEELLTPPVVPLRSSTPAVAAQIKERADTYPDESSSFLPDEAGETGRHGESSESLEKVDEYGLDIACESSDKPFNHLTEAKYGTVSYRKIRRGQTKKRIEMFESMMQL